MTFTTDGIVLKASPVGESDLAVSLLTEDRGVISAFAKSARRPKSRLHAGSCVFSYGAFTFFEGSSALKLTECDVRETFFDLRNDITVLSCAQYLCELTLRLAPKETPARDILRLLLNTLHFMTKPERNPLVLKSVFEMRFASLSGYMPDLVACAECGEFESDPMYFDFDSGLLYCKNCRKHGAKKITLRTVDAMRHTCYAPMNRLFSIKPDEQTVEEFYSLCEEYIKRQTSYRFKTLDFLNSIK